MHRYAPTEVDGDGVASLTDPPRGDELITMKYQLQGMVPGNQADAADFLEWDAGSSNFTLADFHKFPRFFQVRLQGAGQQDRAI